MFILCLLMVLTGTLAYSQNFTPAQKNFLEYVRNNAVTFNNASPSNAELAGLAKAVENKKIVALSESGHDIKEQLAMNAHLTKYLVKEMGFTIVTAETSFVDSKHINDYILGKASQGYDWKKHLVEMYRHQEFYDLIHWLKAHNDKIADDAKKVKFYGVDIPGFYKDLVSPTNELIKYIQKVDLQYAKKMQETIVPILQLLDMQGSKFKYQTMLYSQKLSTQQKMDLSRDLLLALDHFEANKEAYTEKEGADNFSWHRQVLISIYQAIKYYEGNFLFNKKDYRPMIANNVRDLHMYQNFEWIMNKYPNQKSVVINHVIHTKTKVIGTQMSGFAAGFGAHLRVKYGKAFYTIGCKSYYDYSKQNLPADVIAKMKAKKKIDLGAILDEANNNNWGYFIDFKAIPQNSPAYHWYKATLSRKLSRYDISVLLPSDFDAYIYYKNTTMLNHAQ